MTDLPRQRRDMPRDGDADMLRRRNRELATLKKIAERLNTGVALYETLGNTLPLVVELLNLHTGWLFLSDTQGDFLVATHHDLPPALAYPGSPWQPECTCQKLARAGDLRSAAQVVECSRLRDATGDRQGLAYHASVPLVEGERLLGILNVATSEWDMFTPQDLQLLSAVGYQLATAIERTQLAEQATQMALVEERNRLARELHDSVSQKLFGLMLGAESAGTLLDRDPEAAAEQVARLGELAREALGELRELIFELRPASLEEEGLAATLRKEVDVLRRVHGRDIELRIAGSAHCAPEAEGEVLRIAQEALNNALRHAEAERIELRMEARDGRLIVTVADDGIGFDPTDRGLRSRRLGLTSMEERAGALGGTLNVVSRRGEGTTVTLEVPR